MKYDKYLNEKFGKLTCLQFIKADKVGAPSRATYLWQCECGNTVEAVYSNVKSGNTRNCKPCGREIIKQSVTKHKQCNTPLYHCWSLMKQRVKDLQAYANRPLCKEWLDFNNFKQDMEETYFPNAVLDRVDNSKGYCKNNCQWLTKSEHAKKTWSERNEK